MLPQLSADVCITDPPYGLSFMGKGWDHGVPGVPFWAAVLAALKPGAHLLAFGGTRMYHRLACAIEDASFELRDCLMWVYGSGFPKSHDVSKAIDKAAGAEREIVGRKSAPQYNSPVTAATGTPLGRLAPRPNAAENYAKAGNIYAPATDAAKQWEGWGTALKPAWEPILLARKALEETVATNVIAHGTGALNIDGCRVGTPGAAGRWPANLIHDGSEEVLHLFPASKGQQGAVTGSEPSAKTKNVLGEYAGRESMQPRNDTGSAARFFYCAKASKKERNAGLEGLTPGKREESRHTGQAGTDNPYNRGAVEIANIHPTVKPLALMRYLCKLTTPPGGTVLDPFMGSGSTLLAAQVSGFQAVGIDLSEEYCEIAANRLKAVDPFAIAAAYAANGGTQ